MIIDDFASFVIEERKRQGLTLEQVGERCSMTKGNVNRLEHRVYKCGPSIDTCERLLNALGYRLKIVKID